MLHAAWSELPSESLQKLTAGEAVVCQAVITELSFLFKKAKLEEHVHPLA